MSLVLTIEIVKYELSIVFPNLKVNVPKVLGRGCGVDDAAGGRGLEGVQEQLRQQEVACTNMRFIIQDFKLLRPRRKSNMLLKIKVGK